MKAVTNAAEAFSIRLMDVMRFVSIVCRSAACVCLAVITVFMLFRILGMHDRGIMAPALAGSVEKIDIVDRE